MQWLNSKYASWFNRRHGRVGHLFQGRFNGILVDSDAYFLTLCRYVVRNPVRAGMVEHPGQWRWSSYAAKAGLVAAPGWLTVEPTRAMFHPTSREDGARLYREFVNRSDAASDRPWEMLRNQIYLGGEAWLARIQALIDKEPRSPDHPRSQRHLKRPAIDAIVTSVASVLEIDEHEIRNGHGGAGRMLVAYLGVFEGIHFRRTIAAELLVGSSRVSALVRDCERELQRDPVLRAFLDRARETLENRPPPIPYVLRRPAADLIRERAPAYGF